MRLKVTTIFIFLSFALSAQQEHMFTQFMFNKLGTNPAYAGHDNYTSLNLIYRNQWNGFEGAPKTLQLSGNLAGLKNNVGIGAIVKKRSIGITDLFSISGMYSYQFAVQDGILSLGIETTGKRYSLDFTDPRLVASEGLEDDASIPNGEVSKSILNVGFGLYYYAEDYFLSTSITNLMNSELDFGVSTDLSKEVLQLNIMGGYQFILNSDISLTPQFMLRYAMDAPLSIDVNMMASLYKSYFAGINFRSGGRSEDIGESIDLIVGLHIMDDLLLSMAYDIQLSGLRDYNNGSLELLLGYRLPSRSSRVKMVNPRYF